MKKTVDCLIIGHNEMDFREYEADVKEMGVHSGAYRDLNLNFIQYKNRPYHFSEVLNLFCCDEDFSKGGGAPPTHSRSARWRSLEASSQKFAEKTKFHKILVKGSRKPLEHGEIFSATIAYLGTYLWRRGLTFDYVNSFQNEKELLKEKLQQENILTIAITTTYYVFALPVIEIMKWIKKYNQTAKIIIGGPFIASQVRSQDPEVCRYLFDTIGADIYVNSSQGEATLVKIVKASKNRTSLEDIHNIYYKTDQGYAANPVLIEDNKLSENMVNWDLFSEGIEEYVDIRTSISCPFSCSFCGFPQHAGKFQTVGVEDAEKELNQLQKIESVQCISFVDDTSNVPRQRFKDILKMIVKNRYTFKWGSNLRCQFLDREMVELMKVSGFEAVFLGLESGNNQILENMNKATTVEKYREGIALLKEYEITTYGSFIVGFPGETPETVQDTIHFIRDSGIDYYRTNLWYCNRITPIWKQKEKYDLKGDSFEWSHATMDSKTACDLIDKIFLSINNPCWVPQYNFDFDNLWHLIHRRYSQRQILEFIKGFNEGIKEKLLNPYQREISPTVVNKLKKACQDDDLTGINGDSQFDNFGVDFDL